MKKTTFLLLGVFYACFSLAQSITAPAEITSDTQWQVDTVYINEDVSIANGATLSIAPGTVVMANGYFSIDVQGSIQALGTAKDSIYFTVNDTTGFSDKSSTAGGWNGFVFDHTPSPNDSSLFEFCVMQYGKAYGTYNDSDISKQGGLMYVSHFDKIRISYSHIRHNWAKTKGGALFMEYCSAKINQNRFTYNKTLNAGGAIVMEKQSSGIIDRNVFKYNRAFNRRQTPSGYYVTEGHGAAIYICNEFLEDVAPTVSNNFISNNFAFSGVLYDSTTRGKWFNNTIVNNVGTPIEIGHSKSKIHIINNTIAYNYIRCYNCSVINNLAMTGFRLKPLIVNNIIWNNSFFASVDTPSVRYNFLYVDSMQYNLLADSYMAGTTNITSQDPLFVNPSEGIGIDFDGELSDWSLQDESPAVNAGKPMTLELYGIPELDYDLNDRVYGGRIDMGAYENQSVIANNPIISDVEQASFLLYPNPAHSTIQIEKNEGKINSIEISDLTGKIMMSFKGNPKQTIDISNLKHGVYLVKVDNAVQKLIVE